MSQYPFVLVTRGLEANPSAVQCVLRRINNTFSKDSSDCLSTLSAMLELLRLLVTVENTDEGLSMTRTRVLSKQQLCTILDWGPGRQHSLHDLQVSGPCENEQSGLCLALVTFS